MIFGGRAPMQRKWKPEFRLLRISRSPWRGWYWRKWQRNRRHRWDNRHNLPPHVAILLRLFPPAFGIFEKSDSFSVGHRGEFLRKLRERSNANFALLASQGSEGL